MRVDTKPKRLYYLWKEISNFLYERFDTALLAVAIGSSRRHQNTDSTITAYVTALLVTAHVGFKAGMQGATAERSLESNAERTQRPTPRCRGWYLISNNIGDRTQPLQGGSNSILEFRLGLCTLVTVLSHYHIEKMERALWPSAGSRGELK